MKRPTFFNEYQDWVGTKCKTPVECSALGLAGEAGEVVDLLKKVWYHGKTLDKQALKLELGDCLFYLADLARQHDISLQEVADGNVDKLNARYPTGFNIADAQAAEAKKKIDRVPLAVEAGPFAGSTIADPIEWAFNDGGAD